jgi:hypothetical protein
LSEVNASANASDYLKKVVAQETGTTFKAQSIVWMADCKRRKRKPMKPVTLVNWQSYLDNHILPSLGSQPIAEVNNASMKRLVEVLVGKGLAPQSIVASPGKSPSTGHFPGLRKACSGNLYDQRGGPCTVMCKHRYCERLLNIV